MQTPRMGVVVGRRGLTWEWRAGWFCGSREAPWRSFWGSPGDGGLLGRSEYQQEKIQGLRGSFPT